MSLDGYIEDLRVAGEFDSGGAFSLNQAEALQKLRQFQVAKPGHFSTGLVASAIASKADWVRLETPPGDFRLEHNGLPIPHQDLVNLFSSLLVGGPDEEKAPIRELAFGLNALTALKPHSVRVTCSGPQALSVLELDSRQLMVNCAEPYETYGSNQRTSIYAKGVWRGPKKLLRQVPGMRPEITALQAQCRYATVPILWDEKEFVPGPEPVKAVCVARLGSPPSLPFPWPKPTLERDVPWHGWVGICPQANPEITVVMQGLSFRVTTDSDQQGLRAVIYGSDFRKDLSYAGLVQDKRLTAVLEEIEKTYTDLVDSLTEDWSDVPEDLREETSTLLRGHSLEARQRWEGPRADRLAQAAQALAGELPM